MRRLRARVLACLVLASGAACGCGLDRTLLSDGPDAAARDGGGGNSPIDAASREAGTSLGPLAFDVSEYGACAARDRVVSCWGGSSDSPGGAGNSLSPVRFALPEAVRSLEAGVSHFCALSQTGAVYCWGSNGSFQLGNADPAEQGPVRVALPGSARAISCGGAHTCVILQDSTLWCWGSNLESQLGQPDSSLGARVTDPIQVGVESDWLAIGLGDGHSCGIRHTGELWCWGRNTSGQLGLGFLDPGQVVSPARVGVGDAWRTIASGQEGSCALQSDGSAWCWGGSTSGRVGGVFPDPVLTPRPLTTDRDFAQIDSGTFHSCARTTSGTAWCWGRNVEGQLGLGTFTPSEPPSPLTPADWQAIRVGRFHTCALRSDSSLWCAGKNDVGQLGLGDTTRRAELTQIPSL